jgi:hypothetical protein
METTPVRVWAGVHEAIQIYAKEKGMDASALASMELMKALFTEEDLPEQAQTVLARDFFQLLGEGIAEKKDELAKWAVSIGKGKKA